MNFERYLDPKRALVIGTRAIKRDKLLSFLDLTFRVPLGMGNMMDLIFNKKDPELLEIFHEDLLKYFSIPERQEEGWRWTEALKHVCEFPEDDQKKVRDMILKIHDSIVLQ